MRESGRAKRHAIRAYTNAKRRHERAAWKAQYESNRLPAHKRGYDGKFWRKNRNLHLAKNPECVSCGKSAQVVDHIIPRKRRPDLFWNPDNWQSLCHACHNIKTAMGD